MISNLNNKKPLNLRGSKRKFLDFQIIKKPEKLDFNIDTTKSKKLKNIYNKEIKKYKKIDDTIFIYSDIDFKGFLRIGIGLILIGFFLIIVLNIKGNSLFFYSIPILFGIFQIIYIYLKKNKKLFILDRENGLMSYPNFLFFKPVVTKFTHAAIFIGSVGRYGIPALKLKHPNKLTSYSFSMLNVHFWSFMVWYMDKNRPLPPGDVFNAYRNKDFERRKLEGFLKPLYRSALPTPEATPEQQLERDQYWKDEDYMCPSFKTEENSVLFDSIRHSNWVSFKYSDKPLKENSCNAWHRYEFKDGNIVYMRTNKQGKGYQPPLNIEYEVSVVSIK